jgi:hypothetical protein
MTILEKLYTKTYNQSKKLGIIKFKGDYEQWKKEKRRIRRSDRVSLKNASKVTVLHEPD